VDDVVNVLCTQADGITDWLIRAW